MNALMPLNASGIRNSRSCRLQVGARLSDAEVGIFQPLETVERVLTSVQRC